MKIFPTILATITQKPRQLPCEARLSWRKDLWTPNAFTLWRRIFWEPKGIRADASFHVSGKKKGGKYIMGKTYVAFHTVEALLSHIEAVIRGAVPRVMPFKIYVPMLATPGGFPVFASPYLLAVAYDNSQANQFNAVASGTGTAFTIASGASLWVHVGAANTAAQASTVKWNTSESLTSGVFNAQGTFTDEMWYIAAPTSGSHSVAVTFSGNHEFDIVGVSLTGTHASPLGVTGSQGNASSTSASVTIATGTANSWLIDGITENGNDTRSVTGTGQVRRVNFTHNVSSTWGSDMSTEPTTTTGNYTTGYSWTPARVNNMVAAEVKAAITATANPAFLLKMATPL